MPRVINTSANVKPDLTVLCPAVLNGSNPVPIPAMKLKLPCPPPGNPCYYCVFHNLISFFSCNVDFCFLFKKKYLFSQTRSLSVHALVSKTYIFTYSSICVVSVTIKLFEAIAIAERERVRKKFYSYLKMFDACLSFTIANFITCKDDCGA